MLSNRFTSMFFASVLLANFAGNTRAIAPSAPSANQPLGSPLAALRQASAMITQTKQPPVSAREYALFKDIASGQMARWMPADAALLASGVDDEDDRQYYLTIPEHIFLRMGDLDIDLAWNKVYSRKEHDEVVVAQIWKEANNNAIWDYGNARYYEAGDMSLVGHIYYNQPDRRDLF